VHLATHIWAKHGAALSEVDRQQLAQRIDWNAADVNIDQRILIAVPRQLAEIQGKAQSDGLLCKVLKVPRQLAEIQGKAQSDGLLCKVLKSLVLSETISRIEPIYWSAESGDFRYARGLMLKLLDLPYDMLGDDIVDFRIGDKLIDLAEAGRPTDQTEGLAKTLRRVSITYHKFSSDISSCTKVPDPSVREIAAALKQVGWELE
jgi:hypothetical protein